MSDVTFVDKSADLRPKADFQEALAFIDQSVVNFASGDPLLILHAGAIRQALRLAIKTCEMAAARGLERVDAP